MSLTNPSIETHRQHFASDNYAGMCPEAMHWFMEANRSGHSPRTAKTSGRSDRRT